MSGGSHNVASGAAASVSGGVYNVASGDASFVGGGGGWEAKYGNEAFGHASAILGGRSNLAGDPARSDHNKGWYAVVSGGDQNLASGNFSVVSGGIGNMADQEYKVLGDSYTKPRFVDNGDGTVTDKWTGLMWQKATDRTRRDWSDARDYCEDEVSLAGHHDWRMPSIEELRSIVDETRKDLAIDPVFEAVSDWYWSSTFLSGNVWIVGFYNGYVLLDVSGDIHYVRAVRTGP